MCPECQLKMTKEVKGTEIVEVKKCQGWNGMETWRWTRLFAIHFSQEDTNLFSSLRHFHPSGGLLLCAEFQFISREMSFLHHFHSLGRTSSQNLLLLGERINDFTFSGCIQDFHNEFRLGESRELKHVQLFYSFSFSFS